MFASAGSSLKLHSCLDDQLETVLSYRPRSAPFIDKKITEVNWCHDNSYVMLLQEEGRPQILSTTEKARMRLVHTVQAMRDVTAAQFQNRTKRIAALGNRHGEVLLYDTKTRRVVKKLQALPSPVRCVRFNPIDHQLVAAGDNSLTVYVDYQKSNNFAKQYETDEAVSSIQFHRAVCNFVALAHKSGQVYLKDTETNEPIGELQKHSEEVTDLVFFETQRALVSSGMDRKVCIYGYESHQNIFRMNLHQPVTSMDISGDDVHLAVGLADGSVHSYDLRNPLRPLAVSKPHEGPVTRIAFERPTYGRPPFERSSAVTLVESEIAESVVDGVAGSVCDTDRRMEDVKMEMLRIVADHMREMEVRMAEHCRRFQAFIRHEFDTIGRVLRGWEVFNVEELLELKRCMKERAAKKVDSKSTTITTSKYSPSTRTSTGSK